jgi:hypothetical protein
MKQMLTILLCTVQALLLSAQTDTSSVIPRSVDLKVSYAPGYVLSSSAAGTDPAIFPSLASASVFQAELIWDGFLSYRGGYSFQQFETAYNATIASETRRTGVSSIDMHAVYIGVGQAQYFNLTRDQNDFAFVITPWAGLQAGRIRAAWGAPGDLVINGLDSTVSGYHTTEVFTSDSLQGYSLQRLQAGNDLQLQVQLAIGFELRFLNRFHAGVEPFVHFGLQPLYEQDIIYNDRTLGLTDSQRLLSRGTNYGVRFTLRYALWQERL